MFKRILITLLTCVLTMLAFDLLWIGVIANNMYRAGIGHLMLETPHIPSALVFYGVYSAGLLYFVIGALPTTSAMQKVALRGALFGFFAYATYDLTNLATLRGWPVHIALIDMAWGACLSAACAVLGTWVWRRL